MAPPAHAIEANALSKTFGKRTVVDGLDLRVEPGTVHALLGPSGSGKTTVVRMLSTLLRPTSGTARILGTDIGTDADEVRRHIGLVGQEQAVDPRLTGTENLTMIGRLAGLSPAAARDKAAELLTRFGLSDAAGRLVSGWSGGMCRRLDLACGMVVRPGVLFLDEPTTGLDPLNRNEIYQHIQSFVAEGTAVLLTTQYLDEAARLADAVTILDRGRMVATGSPDAISGEVFGRLEVLLADPADRDAAIPALVALGAAPAPRRDTDQANRSPLLPFDIPSHVTIPTILDTLHAAGVAVRDLDRRRPSLDDAFVALTAEARR